jgi:hypothetical protein
MKKRKPRDLERIWSPSILASIFFVTLIAMDFIKRPRQPESGLAIVLFYIPAIFILLAIDVALKLFSKVDTTTLWLIELGAIAVIIALFSNLA